MTIGEECSGGHCHGVERAPYGMRPPTPAGNQERIAHALELIAQRLALLEYHIGELRLEMLEMQMRVPKPSPEKT